jgi:PAS domain S-box-containing protein
MRKKRHHKRGLRFLQAFRRRAAGDVPPQHLLREEKSAAGRTGDGPRQNRRRDIRGQDILRHMSSLLDSVTTGIISLDGEGRVRVFNAAAESLFALPRAKVAGISFREAGRTMPFSDNSLRAFWERLSDAVWAAGAALDLEYDLPTKNGQRRIISYSVYPLGRMAWSVGNGVVIMLENVTRKKEMEEQIGDARKRLLEVFEGITDGIQVVDGGYRVTAVNRSMTALLSRSISIGARCYEAFGAGACPDCPAKETFRSGQPASVTRRLAASPSEASTDDGGRCVEISTFPLLDRGNRVIQVVEYIKDVTEKVRLAERLEHSRRLAELGETAARIAHEVRNPLNAIAGAVHYLAAEYAGDGTIRKFTDLIQRQTMRLNQVASEILNAARPMRLNRTSVNVNVVVWQALAPLRDLIQAQGITVHDECARDLPLIRADELQIEQALHNILRNAVEAMPGGGVLRIATRGTKENGWLDVVVQDTGPGIADEDRERVFLSFYTTKSGGTGLGLSIVQGVLKNHGGEISLERPEEGGTRVVVRLPISGGGQRAEDTGQRA